MKSEKNEKIKILTGVAEVFGFHFSPVSLAIYLDSLEDISLEALKRILSHGIKSNAWRFMPRPGEIIAHIQISEHTRQELKAKDEFEKILRLIRYHGRNGKMEGVSETALMSLRHAGGLERLADADDEQLTWIRKDFENAYDLNAEKVKIESRKKLITGGGGLTDQKKLISNVGNKLANKLDMNIKKK